MKNLTKTLMFITALSCMQQMLPKYVPKYGSNPDTYTPKYIKDIKGYGHLDKMAGTYNEHTKIAFLNNTDYSKEIKFTDVMPVTPKHAGTEVLRPKNASKDAVIFAIIEHPKNNRRAGGVNSTTYLFGVKSTSSENSQF